jgi:hypothetical protein
VLRPNQISHLFDFDVRRSLRPFPQRHRSWQSIRLSY